VRRRWPWINAGGDGGVAVAPGSELVPTVASGDRLAPTPDDRV
jgi:hypothetical protein